MAFTLFIICCKYNVFASEAKTILSFVQDCYIIDTCSNWGLLVWIGVESEDTECEHAGRRAELWLREKNYNYTTPVRAMICSQNMYLC